MLDRIINARELVGNIGVMKIEMKTKYKTV